MGVRIRGAIPEKGLRKVHSTVRMIVYLILDLPNHHPLLLHLLCSDQFYTPGSLRKMLPTSMFSLLLFSFASVPAPRKELNAVPLQMRGLRPGQERATPGVPEPGHPAWRRPLAKFAASGST